MLLLFGFLSHSIDEFFGADSITLHYKIVAGILGAGLILLLARIMKGIVVRKPIRGEAI